VKPLFNSLEIQNVEFLASLLKPFIAKWERGTWYDTSFKIKATSLKLVPLSSRRQLIPSRRKRHQAWLKVERCKIKAFVYF